MATRKISKSKRRTVQVKSADALLLGKIRTIFAGAGFDEYNTDNKKITLATGWAGDIDRTFICENVVVLCERTTTSKPWDHLKPKIHFFTAAYADKKDCIAKLMEVDSDLRTAIEQSMYDLSQLQVCIVYVSEVEIPEDKQLLASFIRYMHLQELRFFLHLVKCVQSSGKFELLRFLGVSAKDFGSVVANGQSIADKTYDAFLLPTEHSSLPQKHEVLSFYADPEFLLQTCYVLRQDGWREEGALYQRLLVPKKLRAMRKHLVNNERVFVNNIIVTLPLETRTESYASPGSGNRRVKLTIPHAFNSTAIIDGQHRVFCYYKGDDPEEATIGKMRKKQNLLVTGVRFPPEVSPQERSRFEAMLFLEINSNQTGAKTALKQEIAVLLTPASHAAIAKRVMTKLNRAGPLQDKATFFL